MCELPDTRDEIDDFIAAFEARTLPRERWTHGAHLLTGACYVHDLGEEAAANRMRERVAAYNLAVGGQNTATAGYHETVTVFWIKLLARTLEQWRPIERVAFARRAVAEFEPRRGIFAEFYDFDVVASMDAGRTWIAPSLKTL